MLYSMKQWAADRDFKAAPGQEITEEVYNQMLNALPPLTLPRCKAEQALQDYKIPVHAGFLMGEPHSNDKNGLLYMAFAMNDYGKGKRYYYIGLSHEAKKTPAGKYYYFDCMNAIVTGRLWASATFEGIEEAINIAANYEADLIEITIDGNGEEVERKTLYSPFNCFE